MTEKKQVAYRLKLVRGFLDESRQDVALRRWRSAVDNAQLSVENAAKAVLALLGPVGRTHNPATLLRQALDRGAFTNEKSEQVRQLAEQAELLGPAMHMQTDYGDEPEGRSPWELFGENDASRALAIAERAAQLAEEITKGAPL